MFYRKYRPQTIEELDSEEIRQKIAASVLAKEFPHAFLFTGPKGTGKTSAARILAKAINCEKREKIEPCNKCGQCVSIAKGSNLDILEIDGASNTGVDDVRDLREKIKLAPSQARYKVYIIDEVHMLSTSAFNALLKTLEEPPKHAVFILCTTEPQKVPETIKSRCLRINFKKATDGEIIRSLKRVVRGEEIKVEENILAEVARHADGSLRDGQKIFEQLLIEAEKKPLTEELVRRILTSSGETIEVFWESLLGKKTKETLEWIERFVKTGGNLSWFMEELVRAIRENLLLSAGVMLEKEPAIKTDLEKEELIALANLLSGAAEETKTAVVSQLPLEIAVVRWCEEKKRADEKPKPEAEAKPKPESASEPSPEPPASLPQTISFTLEQVLKKWPEVLEKIRPYNHTINGLLRGTRIKELQEDSLILEVFYKFHKERLEEPKCRQILEKIVNEIMGEPLRIKCVLGEKARSVAGEKPADNAADGNDAFKMAQGMF